MRADDVPMIGLKTIYLYDKLLLMQKKDIWIKTHINLIIIEVNLLTFSQIMYIKKISFPLNFTLVYMCTHNKVEFRW